MLPEDCPFKRWATHGEDWEDVVVPEVPVCRVNLRDVAEEFHAVDLAEDLIVLQVAQAVQKQLNR
jgi:hypothetical protein